MHLRRDPAFNIRSPNWDTFSRWELRPDRRVGYLDDAYWDPDWAPVISSDDNNDDEDDDNDDEDDHVPVQAPPPSPPRVSGEVFGQIYNGQVIRDDMVNHVVYHYFQAADRGEACELPPELTEEQLAVAVLISQEEERRAFPELADALALSMAPPPPPGPPPMQPLRTPPVRPHREARAEPWDAWPGAAPGWPAGAPPILGWAPGTPTPPPGPAPPPGPPSPPIANWSWSHGPFIDLSGDDDDE
jgi:hypothetical protein